MVHPMEPRAAGVVVQPHGLAAQQQQQQQQQQMQRGTERRNAADTAAAAVPGGMPTGIVAPATAPAAVPVPVPVPVPAAAASATATGALATAPAPAARALPPKVVVKEHDMAPDMQTIAIQLAVNALSKFELERDMARYLKTQFDIRFQPTWHCLVGRHFGSYVTYENGAFIYFYIDKLAILLFRSGNLVPNDQL